MSRESDIWASQRRAGTLDDGCDPNWVVPNCSMCDQRATNAHHPDGCRSSGSLSFPPYDGCKFYCEQHNPPREKRK